ncbi:MAG: hypothetical protein J6J62_05885 [Oscillospiraceae bacterium]|nr:hypothetical protein [Oscillospiraceae bacterium]
MISTKNGSVTISGSAAEVMTDLTLVVRGAKRALIQGGVPEERAGEMVSDAIRRADMSIEQEITDLLETIMKELNKGSK